MKTVKIGTRASKLALYQANLLQKAIQELGYQVEIVKITTSGDADQRDFKKILGDGFFTRTIERALLCKEVDIAIHSAKDLPSLQHHDLPWAAFSFRKSTKDYLIRNKSTTTITSIGTSSPRREKQIKEIFPDAEIKPLRGNVDTRLEKLKNGYYDAILLAKAGVSRLQLDTKLQDVFDFQELEITTAPTQGILAIQVQRDNLDLLKKLQNQELSIVAKQEKEVLRYLGGGCHLAIGANAETKSFDYYRKDSHYKFNGTKNNFLQSVVNTVANNHYSPKVLLTHSIQHHEKAYQLFAEQQIGCQSYPLIHIKTVFTEQDWNKDFSKYDYIFTSPNAVRIFFQEAFARNINLDQLKQKKFFCVGKATAEQLEKYEFNSQSLPKIASSESLLQEISTDNPLFCGNTEGAFQDNYTGESLSLYRSFSYEDIWPLPDQNIEHIIFCSPFSVRYALKSPIKDYIKNKKIYAFGPSTAKALQLESIHHIENPVSGSWQEMVECVCKNMEA